MTRNDSIAALVLAIGRPAFPERLVAAAGATVPHDAAALMILHSVAPPAVLVDRLKPAERSYLYGDYLSGVYTLSPFYRAAQNLKVPRVDRIMDIAPKGFTQSEYYRRYFALIGVDDMMGMLIPASDGEIVFMSFSRSSGSPRFTAAEARSLAAPTGLFSAAVTRHTEIAGPLASRHSAAAAAPAAHKTQPSGLTQREAQVVNLMLEGHSSRAIGEVLKISGETVRVHRRNIYEKLGVSSQAELFRWFLSRQA
jgi:DNA-binding CsgD family transcriptional regulator